MKKLIPKVALKTGDQVVMVNCVEALKYPGKLWTIAHPFDPDKDKVVWLEGFRGSFFADMVMKVDLEGINNENR